jgi:hypothetical protein
MTSAAALSAEFPQDKSASSPSTGLTKSGKFRSLGGSDYEDFNVDLATQTLGTLWLAGSDEDGKACKRKAMKAALKGIKPRNELEGMLAGQLVAGHHAAMECYRRAMIPEQSFESRRENLNLASKLSRTFATLVEAMDRHRGKGQQRITVEHLHVNQGGQAVVGLVAPQAAIPGGGIPAKLEDLSHGRQIEHVPGA